MADGGGWRIDEAAQAVGLSSRNLRAYQSLGLVEAPRLEGRVGRYDGGHLARLRAVRRLQEQGFSLAGIRVLLDAYDRGDTLAGVLGLTADAFGDPRPPGRLRLALVPGPLVTSVVDAAAS